MISEKLVDYSSGCLKSYLRKIDVVTVKGSAEPIALFTFDLDMSQLVVEKYPKVKLYGHEKKRKNYKKRI